MSQNAMVLARQTVDIPPPALTITTSAAAAPPRDLLVPAVVYVSLALSILIVVRGDTAQLAMILPYLAGMLQLLLRRPS